MPNNEDPDLVFGIPVDNRIRKGSKPKNPAAFDCRRAELRVFDHQGNHAAELLEKAICHCKSRCFKVKVQGVRDILFSRRVERVGHRASLACSRAMASCPGTTEMAPDANAASRRSASWSHKASVSGSVSKLAIKRSSRWVRSAGANFRASASKTSSRAFMGISWAIRPTVLSLPQANGPVRPVTRASSVSRGRTRAARQRCHHGSTKTNPPRLAFRPLPCRVANHCAAAPPPAPSAS